MTTLEIPDINTLHANIVAVDPLINVIVQIQSYGRVFVWDQGGYVHSEDDAICISAGIGDSVEDRIRRGLFEFLQKSREVKESTA